MSANHCKDCCCARSWKELGITEYTGKGIPEHIAQLRAENLGLKTRAERAEEALKNNSVIISIGPITGTRSLFCVQCEWRADLGAKFEHAPDCIILTLQTRREA